MCLVLIEATFMQIRYYSMYEQQFPRDITVALAVLIHYCTVVVVVVVSDDLHFIFYSPPTQIRERVATMQVLIRQSIHPRAAERPTPLKH